VWQNLATWANILVIGEMKQGAMQYLRQASTSKVTTRQPVYDIRLTGILAVDHFHKTFRFAHHSHLK
jgi:hypothetical protein